MSKIYSKMSSKISSLVLMMMEDDNKEEMRSLFLKLGATLAAISAALIFCHFKKRKKHFFAFKSHYLGKNELDLRRKMEIGGRYRVIPSTPSTSPISSKYKNYEKPIVRSSRRSKSYDGFVSQEYSTGFSPRKDTEKLLAFKRTNNRRIEEQACDYSNIEVAHESTKARLDVSEVEAVGETNERLRKENEDLTKENDRLKAKRSDDAKEQVYLKWVNACLRYELRNLQAPTGKTLARDLSKNLSPRSEEKARQLVLEYSDSDINGGGSMSSMDFNSDSSESSHFTDTGKDSDISSTMETKKSRRARLFRKLKKLVLHKGSDHSNNSSRRRREWGSIDSFDMEKKTYSSFSSLSSPISTSLQDRYEETTTENLSRNLTRPSNQRPDIPKPRLHTGLLRHKSRSEEEKF